MLRKLWFTKRNATLAPLILGLLLGAAWAQTETVLYSFRGRHDGKSPLAGVVFDQKGNLYGTTEGGGLSHGDCYDACGVVFMLTPEGQETVLYAFCAKGNCTDGDYPSDAPVFDQKGNLYGTTTLSGAVQRGVVFKLTPEGKETVLHTFCALTNCADGTNPSASLVFDGKGNLYGTAGGGAYLRGVVFKITPKGKETVLYSFTGGSDGGMPYAGLTLDPNGNLYGTTTVGGSTGNGCSSGCGVVFKLTPEGKETVLYTFCALTDCTDGSQPYGGLALDANGNLYGTTTFGGRTKSECVYLGNGCGVVFKLTPEGKETVLYTFCALTDCTDGSQPNAGLALDPNGNLYGTTTLGGITKGKCVYGCGVVFKLAPDGKETVLHTFCAKGGTNCTDGANPYAGLIFDRKGNLYGTTSRGGAHNWYSGLVFKITP
jgi:uncharacterized repeat protein (TIGR03803 family)